jgi:hypothetical protein
LRAIANLRIIASTAKKSAPEIVVFSVPPAGIAVAHLQTNIQFAEKV